MPTVHHEESALATTEELKRYHELLKDPHMEIRLAAGKVLLDHGDPAGAATLLQALKGEDLHQQLDSFVALSEKPTKEVIEALQNCAEAEKDAMARFVMKRNLKAARRKLNLE